LKLFQELGEEIKETNGESEFNYDTFKNFCKCHNVSQYYNNIINFKKIKIN
jgi:hypothetical protein